MNRNFLLFTFLLPTLYATGQSYKLHGKITNARLEPLAFVSVQVKEWQTGTTTKENGEYELLLEEGVYDLVISMIGYKSQVMKTRSRYRPLTKIGGNPGWRTLLYFVPIVNVVISIWLTNMISKSFGKDEGFMAGLIFLGFIFWPILGFGSAKYLGPYGDTAAFQAYREKNKFEFAQAQ